MKNRFVIFSTGRDCSPFVGLHFESILSQNYNRFRAITVVDGDQSLTSEITKRYVAPIANETVIGSLASLAQHLTVNDDEILVFLDLDDWFFRPDTLALLNEVYSDPSVWITYGNYICSTGEPGHCTLWAGDTSPRTCPWIFSHLKTMRGFVWNRINKEDFKGPDGEYARACADRAIMYPALEMAGPEHTFFIDTPLVVYNRHVNNNIDKADTNYAHEMRVWFESRPSYSRLVVGDKRLAFHGA
jgi:hypothetical protein